MNLCQLPVFLILVCSLNILTAAGDNPTHFTEDVSVNCGSTGTSPAKDGQEWRGDVQPTSSSTPQIEGSSTASTLIRNLISADDQVPYKTARLSRYRFSYVFQVNPGQKIIRLHFNPAPYEGFKRFKDLFAVEAGAFTLLSNFSASLTANALGLAFFVKEFCVNMEKSQRFEIVFSPTSSQLLDTYAFINGIEIIPVPNGLSYFHGGDIGVLQVVGESLVYVDNSTAFEVISRVDINALFGRWETVSKRKANNNITWKISVDVGFRYLVRIHFSELGSKRAKLGGVVFTVRVSELIANTNFDMIRESNDENSISWYRDYMLMIKGHKEEVKRDLSISLQSDDVFVDGHGPLKGFELMKLSNPDNSLASPNPWPLSCDTSYWTSQKLHRVLGQRNMIATVAIALLAAVNVIVFSLRRIREASCAEKGNFPSPKAGRVCRQFTLDEIQLATKNFSDELLIGRGGFGRVYKGFIDDGRQTVAVKRQKLESRQGAREFLTEIETLTELRHINLVVLIGYCSEYGEMILVYEYMSCGTLSDHLYKLARKGDDSPSLTWKQRLHICIGAGRGLDYLHTGHSLVHRDVKASNILLDENFVAKVSDFGLAKYLNRNMLQSHVSTKFKGTFGYCDPSYFTTGKLTRKSDTYSFGVILLEVLTGRPAVNSRVADDEQSLTRWARDNINNGNADQIIAFDLRGEISEESLKAFVEVAEKCLDDEPKKRPTMAQVVLQLEFALEQQENSRSVVPEVSRSFTGEGSHGRVYHDVMIKEEAEATKRLEQKFLTQVHLERQENVVGFEGEAEKIIQYLTEETEQLDVISIIGMSGLGKTTLAGIIFRDPAFQYEYIRIWVYVSQEFTKRDVFLAILGQFIRLSDDVYCKTDRELARLVAANLDKQKFLIVMDDVWTSEDWDKLQIAFPKSNKMGKVLITSRHEEVARYANINRSPHRLRFLTHEESWLLLRLKVFGKPQCPSELKVLGKLIVEQCGGLPLAIMVIGGILINKFSVSNEMADAALESLLQNLQQLLLYHLHFIKDAKRHIEELEKSLHHFKDFLKDITKKQSKDDTVRDLVWQIWDVVYEAEDVVDVLVRHSAYTNSKNYSLITFKTPMNLISIANQVESIRGKVREIYEIKRRVEFTSLTDGDGVPEESEALVRQNDVVRLEDEVEKLMEYLTQANEQLDVISIIGMPDLGKTMLARKIFYDKAIQNEFPTRIWVNISQDFTQKYVCLAILKELTMLTEDMYGKSGEELAQLVATNLERGKFLIVMDDVWKVEDWDKLQVALPKSNKMGKILLTSCHEEVARYANSNRILVKKFSASNEMIKKINAWKKVFESLSTYLNEDPEERLKHFIAWSYGELPYHLRACFLYLAMFPGDYVIPVWKLICMWIAEGFVQQKIGISLEETAENYLDDLINKNLVRINEVKPDGKVKTCSIHDMLRDFCRTEAGNERENFLQEIKKSSEGIFEPPISSVQKYRRLCIHSHVMSFISSKPYGPRVRSFVCFSEEEVTFWGNIISAIPAAFKLLRVLDVRPIRFNKIPSDMYQLLHLRYIVLSCHLAILPANFSKFWNLQTLVVYTTFRTLRIEADIWNMFQLRHLKTNASASLLKPGKSSKGGEKLQTLDTISPQSCTKEVFFRARNLKKLAIRGQLALLIGGKIGSFDSLRKLEYLEKLKLINDVYPQVLFENPCCGLPQSYMFPPKLKSLTLSSTFLEWRHIYILGMLENLVVLKLKYNAFMGKRWVVADGGFRHLEVLRIGRTDLTVWKASGHHFPELKRLELHNCEQLLGVPFGLAEIPSLQLLDLYRSKDAAASAKEIQKEKKKQAKEANKVCTFKLSIFPVDE